MLNPELQVDDMQNLQDFLLFTVKQVKSMHAVLSALMADVAAVRRTVLQDSEEIADYKNNLRSAIKTAKPLIDEAMRSYDDVIRQIADLDSRYN